jgi:type IV secretory pathway VirB10-like protein
MANGECFSSGRVSSCPDGSSITLDRMEGVDPAGYSGLEDKVDSHWGKVFAGAALSTLLGVNSQLVGQHQIVNLIMAR